jgi:hypothetical protein
VGLSVRPEGEAAIGAVEQRLGDVAGALLHRYLRHVPGERLRGLGVLRPGEDEGHEERVRGLAEVAVRPREILPGLLRRREIVRPAAGALQEGLRLDAGDRDALGVGRPARRTGPTIPMAAASMKRNMGPPGP